ncbi:zinc finger protein GLI1-like, partial [Corapipo altera]|uniref:zinc finger protein GLI1-like n=1 Tax=Corapipo altera TaxID=415028 RepID=UPI000FD657CF
KPQPSPGGQSSCSSDHSPLGSTTNNDSGVEMAGNAGGSYEDLSTLEDVVPGEPMGTSGLMALHKLENLRIDKLKQLRKPAASKGLNLPPIPGAGLPGEVPGLPVPPPASHRRIAELSAAELGLVALGERRSSGTSTVSSAYTVSRRSSLVSPYPPCPAEGAAMPGGTCPADGYDPTASPDESRRSSGASLCGALPGVGNLTPAQRYRLKAKYAAATGGPPPTPLPGVERVAPGGPGAVPTGYPAPAGPRCVPNGLPRRHSSNDHPGYPGSVPPRLVPRHGVRRASDPARTVAKPPAVPRVQRFKSVGNVSAPGAGRTALQPLGGSEANLQRHGFSPRPPSITENVFLESVGGPGPGLLEMEQYLSYPEESFPCPGVELQGGIYGAQRTMGGTHGDVEEGLLQPEFSLPQCQMNQHFPSLPAGNGAVPVPWEGPAPGTLDMSSGQSVGAAATMSGPHCPHQSTEYPHAGSCGQHPKLASSCQDGGFPGGHRSYRLQIKSEQRYPAPAPALAPCPGAKLAGPPPPPPAFGHAMDVGPGGYPPAGPAPGGYMGIASPGARRAQTPTLQTKEVMVRSYVEAQQALMWGEQPPSKGGAAGTGLGGEPGQCQAMPAPPYLSPRYCGYQPKPDHLQGLAEPQHLLSPPCFNPEMVPHPPGGPKPPGHPTGLSYSLAQPGPGYDGVDTNSRHLLRFPPARPVPEGPGNPPGYYPGQSTHGQAGKGGHKLLGHVAASCGGPGHYGGGSEGLKGTSCYYLDSGEQVSNSLDSLDLENTHLDFAAIVEDEEPPPALPGPPSPAGGLLLPSPGGANMAVGDMSSMLSTLAGESHFLNSLS